MLALITGCTGQDGSYLSELLVSKGYEVHGVVRRISQPNYSNIATVLNKITLHTGDMTDGASLFRIIESIRPDEIYNLAAMSHVRDSYDHPEVTQDINAGGLLRIMEACRTIGLHPRIYQACSSEMFGRIVETPQNETTPFHPQSPYGASKVAAFNLARVWREAYGTRISCGILYNHESPRRGEAFLSRKVCKAVAEIATGRRSQVTLGNLDAKRDWGYAKEYVKWINAINSHPIPDDFVIATRESHSVREFVAAAFAHVGIDDWERYVDFDRNLTRPAEVDVLCGDYSKSESVLGFRPLVKFIDIVRLMVDAEMAKLQTFHSDDRRELQIFPEAKMITAKRDTVIGGHYHLKKSERFVLSQGRGMLIISKDVVIQMKIGRVYIIEPGKYHEFHLDAGSVLIGLNSHPYDAMDDYHLAEAAE